MKIKNEVLERLTGRMRCPECGSCDLHIEDHSKSERFIYNPELTLFLVCRNCYTSGWREPLDEVKDD